MSNGYEVFMMKLKIIMLMSLLLLPLVSRTEQVDLKKYYEEQKALLRDEFQAPKKGEEISLKLTNGKVRRGKLELLTTDTVTIKMDVGLVTYSRRMLDKFTRAKLFAEDYAEYYAIARTRALKNKLEGNPRQIGEERVHLARLNIKCDLKKDSDREETVEETIRAITSISTKTKTENCNLKISVFNMTPHDDTYTLEWYFIKTPVINGNKGEPVLGDKGSMEITVPAKQKIVHEVNSIDFVWKEVTVEREDQDSGYISEPKINDSGDEYKGYVVIIKHGDEILDEKSSSKTFLTDEWRQKLAEDPVPPMLHNFKGGKKKKKNS